jgi:tRNA threonylcarbamoyladenosine biosynthesis protein TsaB
MKILALDTSTPFAIVAACSGEGELCASRAENVARRLSVGLFAEIQLTLDAAGWDKHSLDALSVGLGPGSFTGLRVAITTMRTLAQVTGLALYGFSTAQAFARTAIDAGATGQILVLLPSRSGEVYAAHYSNDLTELRAPFACKTADIPKIFGPVIESGKATIAGPLQPSTQALVPLARWDVLAHPTPLAMVELTARAVRSGRVADPMSLLPIYAAPPQISQHKQAKA